MSIQEQKKFISNIHPFDNLTSYELDDLVEALEIIHFKANTTIQEQDGNPNFLYFVLKGLIQEKNDDEVLSVYSKGEIFDPVSLIKNYSKNSFVAIEESICYTLKKIFL